MQDKLPIMYIQRFSINDGDGIRTSLAISMLPIRTIYLLQGLHNCNGNIKKQGT